VVTEPELEERLRVELALGDIDLAVGKTLDWWRDQYRALYSRPPTAELETSTRDWLSDLAERIDLDAL
jgi:hypothetical protein